MTEIDQLGTKDLRRLNRTTMGGWSQRPKIILWDETMPANRYSRVRAWRTSYRVNEAAGDPGHRGYPAPERGL